MQKQTIDLKATPFVLRPEGTASLVHSLTANHVFKTAVFPLKLFYCGEMFRNEKPQLGRSRQFYQFGVEHFDSRYSVYDDLELILICEQIMHRLGLRDELELRVNFIGQVQQRAAFAEHLSQWLVGKEAGMSAEGRKMARANVVRLLDSKREEDKRALHGTGETGIDYKSGGVDLRKPALISRRAPAHPIRADFKLASRKRHRTHLGSTAGTWTRLLQRLLL